jgi:NAD(P)-dependent dehydrogenase (short-subunit alcohol dehydrogenase family)
MTKTWFITGASRGFGRIWAEAALARGDRVAATARDTSTLDALQGDNFLPLALDVTDRTADFAAVQAAHEHFGRLDVVVNNAGYGLFGTIEEASEEEARRQLDTNLLGALWVTQAALPIMREQGSGHILQVSSIGGIVAFPMVGLYNASKWGLEGFSESLAQEVASFGVNVTIVEPGAFDTDWAGSSGAHTEPLDAYAAIRDARRELQATRVGGDPAATGEAILQLVDADDPPLRLFLGTSPFPIAEQRYAERLETWNAWRAVSEAAQGDTRSS